MQLRVVPVTVLVIVVEFYLPTSLKTLIFKNRDAFFVSIWREIHLWKIGDTC